MSREAQNQSSNKNERSKSGSLLARFLGRTGVAENSKNSRLKVEDLNPVSAKLWAAIDQSFSENSEHVRPKAALPGSEKSASSTEELSLKTPDGRKLTVERGLTDDPRTIDTRETHIVLPGNVPTVYSFNADGSVDKMVTDPEGIAMGDMGGSHQFPVGQAEELQLVNSIASAKVAA